VLTKSEILRDASNKLCEQARIERAKAEQVCAAAKETRALSQNQLARIRASEILHTQSKYPPRCADGNVLNFP